MTKIYDEVYQDIQFSQEKEMNDLQALHDKFDELYDKEQMRDKDDNPLYNLEEWDDADDVQYSTDFTDSAEDELYKRYKLLSFQTKEAVANYEDWVDALLDNAEVPHEESADRLEMFDPGFDSKQVRNRWKKLNGK